MTDKEKIELGIRAIDMWIRHHENNIKEDKVKLSELVRSDAMSVVDEHNLKMNILHSEHAIKQFNQIKNILNK